MATPMTKARFVERMLRDQEARDLDRKERERRARFDLMDYICERENSRFRRRNRSKSMKTKGGQT